MFKRLMTTLLLTIKPAMSLKQDSMRLALTSIVSIIITLQVFGAPSKNSKICVLPTCKAKGDDILKTIDFSVDPCTDMYRYSCEKKLQADLEAGTPERLLSSFDWLKKEAKKDLQKLLEEPGYELRGKSSGAIKKVKDLYKTCMSNETSKMEGRKKLIEKINEFGSWSAGTGSNFQPWHEKTWNFQKTLEDMILFRGDTLFRIYLYYHEKERRHILQFSQSSGVKFPKLLQNSTNEETFLSASVRLVESMGGDPEVARIKMQDVISFERKILEIFEEEGNVTQKITTYEHLQTMLGDSIDIKSFLSRYLNGTVFSMNDMVLLTNSGYFSRLGQLITNTPKEILCNYMMWVFITNHIPLIYYTTSRSLNATLYEVTGLMLGGYNKPNPRSEQCLNYANLFMPLATGALYVDRLLKAEARNEVTDMMNKMRSQFLLMVESLDWMDNVTKLNVKERIRAMNLQIGYPDWILDPVKLDDYYKSLKIDSKLFLTTLKSIKENLQVEMRSSYGKPMDLERWLESPADMKTYMDPHVNKIILTAPFIKSPVYDFSVSKPERYGTLAATAGSAFVSILSKQWRNYDKDGNEVTIWSNEIVKKLDELSECITELNTTEKREDMLTLTGGLNVSFNAYRAAGLVEKPYLNVTNDRLFFLSYAQAWCDSSGNDTYEVNRANVNTALSYYEEFAKAFNCTPDSPMYHRNQCHVW